MPDCAVRFECSACGHKFERFHSIKAAPIKACPACGKNKAQRLISTGAGLIFKGSGFYITDYRSEGYKEKAKSEAGTSSDGKATDNGAAKESSKPAAKTDAAPAAKPEPKPVSRKDSKSTPAKN